MNSLILAHAEDPTLQTFRDDVWWIVLIKLLGVFVEAGWPAHGVYRALPANVASTGLFVAVQDGNFPSEEERRLLLALSEFGMYAVKSTSPKLTHPKALELLVGHRPTL